jgi:hypothetical protein
LFPGLIDAVGPLAMASANVVAASVMTWFIHATLERSLLEDRAAAPVRVRPLRAPNS